VRKAAPFWSHFLSSIQSKTILLPRQARDKHITTGREELRPRVISLFPAGAKTAWASFGYIAAEVELFAAAKKVN